MLSSLAVFQLSEAAFLSSRAFLSQTYPPLSYMMASENIKDGWDFPTIKPKLYMSEKLPATATQSCFFFPDGKLLSVAFRLWLWAQMMERHCLWLLTTEEARGWELAGKRAWSWEFHMKNHVTHHIYRTWDKGSAWLSYFPSITYTSCKWWSQDLNQGCAAQMGTIYHGLCCLSKSMSTW